jgi:hypothetical protein
MWKGEPNPPIWPKYVKLIKDTDDMLQVSEILKESEDTWDDVSKCYTGNQHFSKRRLAFLFAPGSYKNLHFEVGYYVQVIGLGNSPDQVFFSSGPHVPALNKQLNEHGSSLDTFWRGAENFCTHDLLWAVSQAAPLRRVHVKSNLYLSDGPAYASGGFMANCQVDGTTFFGSQQQWLSRNCSFGKGYCGGAWSLVIIGCVDLAKGSNHGNFMEAVKTEIPRTPVRIEKPYIVLKEDGIQYELRVPLASRETTHQSGCHFDSANEVIRDFSRVFVADPDNPVVNIQIQDALESEKDVILAPGIFHLDKTLRMLHPNQVLLGLGFATLVAPPDGSPCISVLPKLGGVRIAGIMLEASIRIGNSVSVTSLLEWGSESKGDVGDANNPGGLFDIFCRVGGDTEDDRNRYFLDVIMRIHSGHVIGDNIWLWRADHAKLLCGETPNYPPIPKYHQTEETEYKVKNGIHLNGDDICMYGLAVEHMNEHQVLWNGERGQTYFYQCELPYDVSQDSFGQKGYTGYLVDETVTSHLLVAPGVYSNFRNEICQVQTAIKHPERKDIVVMNPFTVKLDNYGHIQSIINGNGEPATATGIPSRLEFISAETSSK